MKLSSSIRQESSSSENDNNISFSDIIIYIIFLGLDASTLTLNNIPYNLSIIITPFIIIITGIANLWSYRLIGNFYEKNKNDKAGINFESYLKHKFGNKLTILIIIFIILNIYNIGQIIIHQILIYRLLAGIINIIGGYDYESTLLFISNTNFNKIGSKFIVNFVIFLFILFPFSLSQNTNTFSTKGFFIFIFVTLVILLQFPFYLIQYKNNYDINVYHAERGFTKSCHFLQSFGIFFFCFSGHNGLIYALEEFDKLKKEKNDIKNGKKNEKKNDEKEDEKSEKKNDEKEEKKNDIKIYKKEDEKNNIKNEKKDEKNGEKNDDKNDDKNEVNDIINNEENDKKNDENEKQRNCMFNTSIIINMVIYLIMSICGYLCSPNDVIILITERKRLWYKDITMTISRIILIPLAINKIQINLNYMKNSFYKFFGFKEINDEKINLLKFIPTLIPLIITTILASFYQNIATYICIIGSFFVVFQAFFIPTFLMKIPNSSNDKYIILIRKIIGIILCAIGITSGIFKIIDIAQTKETFI